MRATLSYLRQGILVRIFTPALLLLLPLLLFGSNLVEAGPKLQPPTQTSQATGAPTTVPTGTPTSPPTSTVREPTDTPAPPATSTVVPEVSPTNTLGAGEPTATPDCSSVNVYPTDIWPPGAFIYVTVPPGWTWRWVPITPLTQYHCGPDYPIGVGCYWSCTNFEPRVGSAEIDIYDQNGVQRCSVGIEGNQPWCPSTDTPTDTPTGTPTATTTATACTIQFTDVQVGSTFYPYIHCLACLGIINGYSDGTFKPNNDVTRGQLSKIISNAAGFSDNQTTQMFQDVPVGSTFFQYISRLASTGFISGYACGGNGEPCVPPAGLPYFRPNNNATRGQISKIDSNAVGFTDTPTGQQFQDVAPNSPFYAYIYRLVLHQVMSGYPCGTPPAGQCVPPGNLPYFLPNNNATRGQTSKIVSNTFFPDCQIPNGIRR